MFKSLKTAMLALLVAGGIVARHLPNTPNVLSHSLNRGPPVMLMINC